MKMFVYGLREYDERVYFDEFSKKYDVEFASCGEKPTLENAGLAAGYDAINILTAPVDKAMIDKYSELGIRCIATRTIGYDHIDNAYAHKIGIRTASISYDPTGVADYSIMMMLMGSAHWNLITSFRVKRYTNSANRNHRANGGVR